ncbi:MAG: phosphopantetheine-binding protein [Hyphomicrobiaceae bacterium]
MEIALGSLPEIREAVVLVREDGGREAQLVAYLLGTSAEARPSTAGLRAALMQKLPDYFVPSVFIWMERFPYSSNGKVDRRSLPPPPADQATAERPATLTNDQQGNDIVAVLRDAWGKVLQRHSVDVDENFFDAGGSSLGLVEIQSQLSQRLGRKIPIVLLFANPTIRSAAAALSAASAASEADGDRRSDRAALMRGKFDRAKARRKAG